MKFLPSTEARSSTVRSAGSRPAIRAASTAWMVGGRVVSLAAFLVGGDELLEKQRVALGGPDDPCRLDRPHLA